MDIYADTFVAVYDIEEKKIILQYSTLRKCANELGVAPATVQKAISPEKMRIVSTVINKTVACRLKPITGGFKEIHLKDYQRSLQLTS